MLGDSRSGGAGRYSLLTRWARRGDGRDRWGGDGVAQAGQPGGEDANACAAAEGTLSTTLQGHLTPGIVTQTMPPGPRGIASSEAPRAVARESLGISGADESADAIHEAVAWYFATYSENIYRYLRRAQCARADAEEITQDIFLGLHRAVMKGRRIHNVVGWLFQAARRRAIDHRYPRYERPVLTELPQSLLDTLQDEAPTCEDDLHARQVRAAVARAVQDCTPLQRQCLDLRSQGHSLKAISTMLGVSQQSVSNAYRRAVRRLSQQLT